MKHDETEKSLDDINKSEYLGVMLVAITDKKRKEIELEVDADRIEAGRLNLLAADRCGLAIGGGGGGRGWMEP